MEKKEIVQKMASLQKQIDIKDIKKDTIVLKDGSLRGILAVSSINFDLKSQEEQEAIVYNYQRFLNTLDFPVQILISSKKFDIDPYIELLEKQKRKTFNEMLKNQINDYVSFVSELTKISNIMSTYFYIITPFYPIEQKKESFLDKISNIANPRKTIYQKRESFETCRSQLFLRMEQIKESLISLGLEISSLKTNELIELFYNFFNPSEFEYNKIEDIEQLQLEENL